MILFTILTIVLIALIAITIAAITIGGVGFIIIFGDVIVCVFIIMWVLKKLWKK